MSFVAMAGIAVVFVGALWYDGWQVRRVARQRQLSRRNLRTVTRLAHDVRDHRDPAALELEASIEHAVLTADLAWAYRHRFETRRDRAESPFQIRRGRVEHAEHRFGVTLDVVDRAAQRWLLHGGSQDVRRRHAVEQLLEVLVHGGKTRSCRAMLEQTLEVLEQTLVTLRTEHRDPPRLHPFR